MEKRFICEGKQYSFEEMISANADDEEVVEWLGSAKIGDFFPGVVTVQRIQ